MTVRDIEVVLPDHLYRAPPFEGIVEYEFCPVFVAREASAPQPNPIEVGACAYIEWEEFVRRAQRRHRRRVLVVVQEPAARAGGPSADRALCATGAEVRSSRSCRVGDNARPCLRLRAQPGREGSAMSVRSITIVVGLVVAQVLLGALLLGHLPFAEAARAAGRGRRPGTARGGAHQAARRDARARRSARRHRRGRASAHRRARDLRRVRAAREDQHGARRERREPGRRRRPAAGLRPRRPAAQDAAEGRRRQAASARRQRRRVRVLPRADRDHRRRAHRLDARAARPEHPPRLAADARQARDARASSASSRGWRWPCTPSRSARSRTTSST